MKEMNNFHKYGWITMIAWNLLLVILMLTVSTIRKVPFTYIFDDGMGGVGISLFLLLWSLIWYGIGYKSRKDFVLTRNMYKEQVPLLEQTQFNKPIATITSGNKPNSCRLYLLPLFLGT
jgi:hypothetical protein